MTRKIKKYKKDKKESCLLHIARGKKNVTACPFGVVTGRKEICAVALRSMGSPGTSASLQRTVVYSSITERTMLNFFIYLIFVSSLSLVLLLLTAAAILRGGQRTEVFELHLHVL